MRGMKMVGLAMFAALAACESSDGTEQPPAPATKSPTPPPSPSEPTPPAAASTPTPIVSGDLESCGQDKELDVPASGLSFTVTVDTRSLLRAHLAASARALAAESPSSFAVDVTENGAVVEEGWDVCVGNTDPSCFANVEMDPGIGVRTFTIVVRPKTPSAASRATVGFCVLDPLE